MKSSCVAFLIAMVTLVSHAQTQQWGQVYFDNSVLPTNGADRLVRLFGARQPLVGTNFVAELLYGTSPSTRVSLSNAPAARFRPEGTPYPGTWSGGMRTLVGIPPGTQTYMHVDVWNNDEAATYDEAVRNGKVLMRSTSFTYVPPSPGSSIDAHYISNFYGFTGDYCVRSGPRSILVQPTNQIVRIGDNVVISVLSTNACGHQWQFNGTNINALPGSRFLVLTNVQPFQAGDYRVIIDGAFGGGLTSQVARLTVQAPPRWGEVLFENSVAFTTPRNRLVRFPDASPVVGTNFVAQLFYGTNQHNLIVVTNP